MGSALGRVLSAAALAVIGALTLGASAVAASAPLPVTAGKAVRAAAGDAAYVPTSLPAGYRFVRWKDATGGRPPLPGQAWFVVTFRHGAVPLLWTVTLASGAADEQVCDVASVGHSTVSGQVV